MDLLIELLRDTGIEDGTAADIAAHVDDEAARDGYVFETAPRSMAAVLKRLGWHRRKTNGVVLYSRRGAPWPEDAPVIAEDRPVREFTAARQDKVARIVRDWDAHTDVVAGSPSTLSDAVRDWYGGRMVAGLGGQSVARVLLDECQWVRIGRRLHKRHG